MSYSVERVYQIWDDQHGERVEVRSDRDALDLVEVRSYDSEGKCERDMTFTREQARLLAKVLVEYLDTCESTGNSHKSP